MLVYFMVGLFYGHLVYFVAFWSILWLFTIFFPFWYVVPRKIWQPCPRIEKAKGGILLYAWSLTVSIIAC
jgi:hypothetical protein